MPNKTIEDITIKLAKLEERVKGLMVWQKWQMVVLAGILIAVISRRF